MTHVIPDDRTLDTVSPSEWRLADAEERATFKTRWARRGHVSFVCLTCGYPTAHGQAICEACTPSAPAMKDGGYLVL